MSEKDKAVAYITGHNIGPVLQSTLNSLYNTKPTCVYGYLSDELERFASNPTIKLISGYKVRSLHCNKDRVRIQVTCSTRNHEEVGESVVAGHDGNSNMSLDDLKLLNDELAGLELAGHDIIDNKIKSLDVSDDMKLTVSTAVYKAGVMLLNSTMLTSLRSVFNQEKVRSPQPIVTLLTSGKHCPGKSNVAGMCICPGPNVPYIKGMDVISLLYDKVEEILKKKAPFLTNVAANGGFYFVCDKVEQMLELVKEAAGELTLEAGNQYYLVLDCSAQTFHTEVVPGQGSAKKSQEPKEKKKMSKRASIMIQSTSRHRYDWVEGLLKPSEDLCEMLENLVETEKIGAVIDPLHWEDKEGYARLVKSVGERCHVLSRHPVDCPGVSVINRLSGTLSESIHNIQNSVGPVSVLQAASYEEGDTLLADLALAGSTNMVLFGGLRGTRLGLYNQLSTRIQQTHSIEPAMSDWGFVSLVQLEAEEANTQEAE